MASTYVALLRGVNVGGKNKLPMKALAAMFTGAGATAPENAMQNREIDAFLGTLPAAR